MQAYPKLKTGTFHQNRLTKSSKSVPVIYLVGHSLWETSMAMAIRTFSLAHRDIRSENCPILDAL